MARSRNEQDPVFIFGAGRSGTTLLFGLLGRHPELAWLSGYSDRLPRLHAVAALQRLHDLPERIDRRLWKWRAIPHPAESYAVLNSLTDGLFTVPRRVEGREVGDEVRIRFRRLVDRYRRWSGRGRFLHKHTGFARTSLLGAIFPGAHFVHIRRDGRAVANSLLRMEWFSGDLDGWQWGELKDSYRSEYEESGGEPIVAAAITWKTLMDAIDSELSQLPAERVLEVRYEALIRDVHGTLQAVLDFSGMAGAPRFWRQVDEVRVSDMDTKWRRQLTPEHRLLLERSLASHLSRYGYDRA